MLWTLICQEWRKKLREGRFLAGAVLCVVLAAVSMLVLHADLRAKKSAFQAHQTIYRRQAEGYGSYRQLQQVGLRVERPPQDFQVLFLGLEKTADRTALIAPAFLAGFEGEWNAQPLLALFPVADGLFVVGVVLSLLAFFLSYDAVAGERERDTLKLLLSYPVPRDTVILAKWLGGYLSLALPFLVSLGLSALLISLSGEVHFTGEDWAAWAVTGLASLLLLGGMFSLGLLVSVRARHSSTAILTLLAWWVVLALAVPSAGPYLAEVVAPAPDAAAVEREITEHVRGLTDQFERQWRSVRQGWRPPAGGWSAAAVEQRRQHLQQMAEARARLQAAIERSTEARLRAFERQVGRQVEVARLLTRLSPVAAYVYANTEISGMGVRHEQRLLDQLRVYQQQFRRYLDEKLGEEQERGIFPGEPNERYTIGDLPVFVYRSEALPERVAARRADLLVLVVFAVLFFLLAVGSFLRTDIA